MAARISKPASDSNVTLQQLMLPSDANAYGKVHGGLVMKLVDEAGAIAAIRHAQRPCVTVTMDSMSFLSPVEVGQLLSCVAQVTFVGTTSIEVGVTVHAEDLILGRTTHTNSAHVVYVALDDEGRPSEVPRLELVTEEDRERWREGERRQGERLARARRSSGAAAP